VKTPLVEVLIRHVMNREGLGCEQAASGLMRDREHSQPLATADQVTSAVLFGAGDAADNITGIKPGLGGGWTAQQSFTAGHRIFCQ
jgi:hypothetical protein